MSLTWLLACFDIIFAVSLLSLSFPESLLFHSIRFPSSWTVNSKQNAWERFVHTVIVVVVVAAVAVAMLDDHCDGSILFRTIAAMEFATAFR